jgi:predicted 2-oxoglutarate/Fe(II)-dependent dioxygenase YbiX
MFDITKLALKIPNFLTHEECDGLIQEFNERREERSLEGSKNYHTNSHKTSSFTVVPLISKTPNFNLIKNKTKKAIETYINYLSQPEYFFTDSLKNSLRFSHNYRIMEYTTGAEIHPHSDHDMGTYGSISFNLNDDYEGGVFTYFNGKHSVELKKGDALIFPADYFWVHEVTPVTKGTRYSLNSFLRKYPSEIMSYSNYLGELLYKDYLQTTPSEELLGPYN